MDPTLIIRGFVLGFTIAAAVGPISLLCIRRTLAEGRLVGLVSGMGVATADATYGAIAAFGLTAITDLLVDGRRVLGVVGGAFLLWLAWRTFRAVPAEAAAADPGARRGLARRLPFHARADADEPDDDPVVRGAVRRPGGDRRRCRGATLLTLGVFAGSAAWWVVLVAAVGALRTRITPVGLRRVNMASGLLIGAFAIVALASAAAG